jgi:hypothetical protein
MDTSLVAALGALGTLLVSIVGAVIAVIKLPSDAAEAAVDASATSVTTMESLVRILDMRVKETDSLNHELRRQNALLLQQLDTVTRERDMYRKMLDIEISRHKENVDEQPELG